MNFKDVNVTKFLRGNLRKLIELGSYVSSNLFPETMKRMIIVNAPYLFKLLFGVVKTFLDKSTQDKIQIYSDGAVGKLNFYIDL